MNLRGSYIYDSQTQITTKINEDINEEMIDQLSDKITAEYMNILHKLLISSENTSVRLSF